MKRKIYTKNAPEPVGPYSQAILTTYGHLIFISGQIPINPRTNKLVKGGIHKQTRQVMKNIIAILKKENLTIDNLIKCDIYLTDLNNFQAFNEEYKKFFKNNNFPARVTVGVSQLPLGALIEISAIAGM